VVAPNALAQFPATTLNQQYRMGPAFEETEGVDFWWNTEHEDGTFTLAEEPTGWEGLEYIAPIDQVGGRDGGLVGPASIAPRLLNVNAMISADNEMIMRQKIAAVRRILGPQSLRGARQPVIWEQYAAGHGERLAMITRPTGQFVPLVAWGGTVATFQFTLVAANPTWKYLSGPYETDSVGLTDPGLLSGRAYNKTYDYTYGTSTNPGGEMVVFNRGDLEAYPVFTIDGYAHMPTIINVTTGQQFKVVADLDVGDRVVINSRTGSVTPSTVALVGRPFTLAPGANTIRWRTFADVFDPNARLRLDWRSTYS
jgi:hypothetical protein